MILVTIESDHIEISNTTAIELGLKLIEQTGRVAVSGYMDKQKDIPPCGVNSLGQRFMAYVFNRKEQ